MALVWLNDQGVADWPKIGNNLGQWLRIFECVDCSCIGIGLGDKSRIGRLVSDWHMSQSLPSDWGLGKDCITSEDW